MTESESGSPDEHSLNSPADAAGAQPAGRERTSDPIIIDARAYRQPAGDSAAVRSPEGTVEWYRAKRRRQLRICLFLFAATFISTTLVGSNFGIIAMLPGFSDPDTADAMATALNRSDLSEEPRLLSFHEWYREMWYRGLSYSIPLMLILLCHEMGHFLQAVRHRVPASYPFFIPLPIPPLGTMGAVIAQGRGAADRKQMFDIAVSGPVAGLIVTLPVLYLGIQQSDVIVMPPGRGLELGEPLIIQWLIAWIHGPLPDDQTLLMNGVAMAGWVGVFVTALNLFPVGQLDGGHLTYTLLGRRAHAISIAMVCGAIVSMIAAQTFSYSLFLLLILLTGARHPPTRDDSVPLGPGRHLLGWLTLSFLLIGFTPTPIIVS